MPPLARGLTGHRIKSKPTTKQQITSIYFSLPAHLQSEVYASYGKLLPSTINHLIGTSLTMDIFNI